MASSSQPAKNGFVRRMRKLYNPLGFSKGYNFTLFFIFGGALFGFSLSRLEYLAFNSRFCPPIETSSTTAASTYYRATKFSRYHVDMLLHLSTVLPAGILAVFQFVPIIRHRYILYHRLAGYTLLLLIILGNIGAIMIADISMGGDLPTQTFVGLVGILTIITFCLAIYNVRCLQVDQHRAWMLRTWFYIGFIITLRPIQIIMALIISTWAAAIYYTVISCDELQFIYRNNTKLYSQYPACLPSNSEFTLDNNVVVQAKYGENHGQTNAALEVSFAAAGFLALVLHLLGVEIYLKMTPREGERLRQVSYEKQLEKGMRSPGSMGLVLEKLADMDPWRPAGGSEVADVSDAFPTVKVV